MPKGNLRGAERNHERPPPRSSLIPPEPKPPAPRREVVRAQVEEAVGRARAVADGEPAAARLRHVRPRPPTPVTP